MELDPSQADDLAEQGVRVIRARLDALSAALILRDGDSARDAYAKLRQDVVMLHKVLDHLDL